MSSTASAQTVFSGEVTGGTISIGTLDLAVPELHLIGTGLLLLRLPAGHLQLQHAIGDLTVVRPAFT